MVLSAARSLFLLDGRSSKLRPLASFSRRSRYPNDSGGYGNNDGLTKFALIYNKF